MRNLKYILFLPLFFFFLHTSHAQKEITIDKIWKTWEFRASSPRGFNFLPHSNQYTRIEGNAINVYDIVTGERVRTMYDGKNDEVQIEEFKVLGDDDLLILTEIYPIYRRSTREKVFFYDAESEKLQAIANGEKVMYASVDSDKNRIAFVRENNLYIQDLSTGDIHQITSDGAKNKIINGASDWVYEEEFSLTQSYEWSPDGKYIAYLKFDESQVPMYELFFYHNKKYPTIYKYKYPKVGENNSIVTVHIYNTSTGETHDINLDAYYIPRIQWSPAGNLIVTTMNRHQNRLDLLRINPENRGIDTIIHEESDTYIAVTDAFRYIEDGEKFIWQSERNGWKQLFLYTSEGKLLKNLTPIGTVVTDFYGFDEKRNEIVYQAALDPLNRQIIARNITSGEKRTLEAQIGTNSAAFSPTFDYYRHTFQTVNTPPVYTLKKNDGKVVKALEDNAGLLAKIKEYDNPKVEFFKLMSAGEESLNAWMIKPSDFNPDEEYPVFMYVYGGPGAQTVRNSWMWNNYWWFQMLADKGIIIVSVDNRGTGGRGTAFKNQTYLNLGKMETADQINAARQLAALPYVDEDRIGIFGWSYGGFMAANCIFKGNEVFDLAISVAPVTHWKWYDTIYTERYMRTVKENKAGYESNSPINFADQLKGDYLLIHGTADDNVHFQNTVELTRALIKAGKQFETYFYPNRNHGIYGNNARPHLYTKMTHFILKNFDLLEDVE